MSIKLLRFTKMHGLGNDFIIIDHRHEQFDPEQVPIVKLANRYTGIGFDQLLVLEPAKHTDFFCRFFNADGSEAEQCGNGLRCIARYIHENQLAKQDCLALETKAGIHPVVIKDYEHIQVAMGKPIIHETLLELKQNDAAIIISALSLGNPHAIVKVTNLSTLNIKELASLISNHAYFPEGANVGFMQIVDANHLLLRTIERGVGETHACGSNACAAVIAGIANQWLNKRVKVEYRYGSLLIEWLGKDNPIYMTGPAESVYTGEVTLTSLRA